MMKNAALLSGLVIMLTGASASAADYNNGYSGASTSFLSEMRMGVLAHDVSRREEGSIDLQAEALFQPLPFYKGEGFLKHILAPRPHIGGTINTSGDTSYGYAGVTWDFPVYGPVFIEATFGGMVHNGKLDNTDPDLQPLGTRALFRESASLGINYDRMNFLITVEHMSNAGIDSNNPGITNVGARVGYKF